MFKINKYCNDNLWTIIHYPEVIHEIVYKD